MNQFTEKVSLPKGLNRAITCVEALDNYLDKIQTEIKKQSVPQSKYMNLQRDYQQLKKQLEEQEESAKDKQDGDKTQEELVITKKQLRLTEEKVSKLNRLVQELRESKTLLSEELDSFKKVLHNLELDGTQVIKSTSYSNDIAELVILSK